MSGKTVSARLDDQTAWLIGWTLILEYAIGAATVSISWSAYLVSFLQDCGISLPTAIIASPPFAFLRVLRALRVKKMRQLF